MNRKKCTLWTAVFAGLLGFLEALAAKARVPELPDTPVACFLAYLSHYAQDDITELCRAIIDRYPPDSGEFDLITHRLPGHAGRVYEAIRSVVR